MGFTVHVPGTYSLLVDFGRPHSRSLGVPIGGAADRASLALGNAMIGNPPDALALELTLAGPTLEATADHGCVVYGAGFRLWVHDALQPVGKTFMVRAGDFLTISTSSRGLRGYLCVAGGFQSKEVLGSRSAFETIQPGQVLECPESRIQPRFAGALLDPAGDPHTLRTLPGTHLASFPADQFFGEDYVVRANSNRMGLRLEGKPLPRPEGEQLSAPVAPGTVQITHDGQPIVLGVDAQTIGGYARIAHVITADLDKLGQLAPGEHVQFQQIEMQNALVLNRQRQAWLHDWVVRLRTASI